MVNLHTASKLKFEPAGTGKSQKYHLTLAWLIRVLFLLCNKCYKMYMIVIQDLNSRLMIWTLISSCTKHGIVYFYCYVFKIEVIFSKKYMSISKLKTLYLKLETWAWKFLILSIKHRGASFELRLGTCIWLVL